ncbi:MAG: RNA-directed DNA polymerase [Clostridia bacterium]|nr:RNA-directed DNA polymerase [Clostridia bacterium]
MTELHPDIIIRYIRTKNKTRKLATYRSVDCDLRKKHEQIEQFLTAWFVPSIFAKGYVKNRSIFHNAQSHMYNDHFVMLDIKDFFPHICHKQLSEKLYYELNRSGKNVVAKSECNDIVDICSIGSRGLPLGFVTSPTLSNLYLKEFDGIFYGKLKKLGLNNVIYTRYADDLTISFKTVTAPELSKIEESIVQIAQQLLKRYGLQLNMHKTRSYDLRVSNHVRITGVNVIVSEGNRRRLSAGRSLKNKLFWDAIECAETRDPVKTAHVKGMQSFILSVEKEGYETCFSKAMIQKVESLGFSSLKELIDSL